MTGSHESSAGSAWDWLARARGSLSLAKVAKPSGGYYEDLCFQAQQAAEKALKAACMAKGITFRFTHDIEELGSALAQRGMEVPACVREAVVLTRYAVETRYPGCYEASTEAELEEAVNLAEGVIEWVERLIEP